MKDIFSRFSWTIDEEFWKFMLILEIIVSNYEGLLLPDLDIRC